MSLADAYDVREFDKIKTAHDTPGKTKVGCIIDLSGHSIAKTGQPVMFPDFTRGLRRTNVRVCTSCVKSI